LLSPAIYFLARGAGIQGIFPQLSRFDFTVYFSRTILLVLLILILPGLRWMGFKNWHDLGLEKNLNWKRDWFCGMSLGSILLGLTFAILFFVSPNIALDERFYFSRLFENLIAALLIAVIEELLFRGVLFGILRKQLNLAFALTALSVFFALIHFARPPQIGMAGENIFWYSGFFIITSLFEPCLHLGQILGSFTTLFLVSAVLCYCVFKTNSLFFSMGLHAGWVFIIKSFQSAVVWRIQPTLWLGKDLRSGVVPIILIALSGLLSYFIFNYFKKKEHAPRAI